MWRYGVSILKPNNCYFHCKRNYFSFSKSNLKNSQINKSSNSLTVMATITESNVGILCFISNLPGFRGILKQRYSDFIVNEVNNEGNVVHLTSLDAPPETLAFEEGETKTSDQLNKSYASEIEKFRSLACETDVDQLEALINQITSGSEKDISPIVLSPDSDKAHRTAMHNFFKENLRFLVTDTVDGPDSSSKCIRVRLNSGNNNRGGNFKKRKRGDKPFDSRGSSHWPEHLGKFLRFHLFKENKDTQEALGLIGKMLAIQTRSFGFAGTKDKRSVSTQRVTVFKQHASRLAALNERLIGIKMGDFCYVKDDLLLGQLLGNHFTITLRGVVADSEDTIKASAESLGRHGFINYFGLQRFGSGSIPTHHIGATLLRGEWKAAASIILDPREGERNIISKAREYYKETGDIDGTLRQLPRHLVAERAMLQCLKKCPGNYLQALKAIPRTLRMMYVHSYQSYLWNHAASVRVQKYGSNEVVLGDLVYIEGDDAEKMKVVPFENEDDSIEDADDCSQLDEISGKNLPLEKNNLVKVITAADISAGTYTIEDVVLPMPGSRIIYPTNEVTDVYHDMAKKDGISLRESVHSTKEFSITSMTGSYRRVFQKPIDFQWELLSYTDGNIALSETDLDKIAKTKPVNLVKEEHLTNGTEGKEPFDHPDQVESFDDDKKFSTDCQPMPNKRSPIDPSPYPSLSSPIANPNLRVSTSQRRTNIDHSIWTHSTVQIDGK
ncbi:LOW QUALITY PROTEIN: multisubstrate pseudouridine synthase 7-like [Hibiscus syriacus]|uniref:LOW QUALITY PROTEIN: multisubstrate pseudouridine synthase 7-like n=1 Tax=Hibiscus syriacus TaxID=106335 RepID=UPI001922DB83|nr:LOW QUALITY PROTEIN: multisubstrate pseudouridine synthase 7-like [Hibiscus syriacus]